MIGFHVSGFLRSCYANAIKQGRRKLLPRVQSRHYMQTLRKREHRGYLGARG